MNLLTAAKMLVLLEQSPPDDNDDDAYFIIQRLLRRELTKATTEVTEHALRATREESLLATSDKVRAIKMYRERTRKGLYDAKIAVEEGARQLAIEEARQLIIGSSRGVSSCN